MRIPRPFSSPARRRHAESEDRPVGNGRRLLEAHAGRHLHERRTLRNAHELRVSPGAHTPEWIDPEDTVADLELGDCGADGCDLAGELAPGDPPVGAAQAVEEAGDERRTGTSVRVGTVDGARLDPDEHFVVGGNGALNVLDPQDLRRPVSVADDRSHAWVTDGSVRRDSRPAPRGRAPPACHPPDPAGRGGPSG